MGKNGEPVVSVWQEEAAGLGGVSATESTRDDVGRAQAQGSLRDHG